MQTKITNTEQLNSANSGAGCASLRQRRFSVCHLLSLSHHWHCILYDCLLDSQPLLNFHFFECNARYLSYYTRYSDGQRVSVHSCSLGGTVRGTLDDKDKGLTQSGVNKQACKNVEMLLKSRLRFSMYENCDCSAM